MSLYGYKKKWNRRTYLGPAAELKNATKPVAMIKEMKFVKDVGLIARIRGIRPISENKKKSDALYRAISKPFLALPENNFCRVHFALTGQKIQATCIHHIRGRHKTLKFDTRFFCPTASKNSLWPHQNIEKARALGLIALAGDWHNEPNDAETERIRALMQEKGIK